MLSPLHVICLLWIMLIVKTVKSATSASTRKSRDKKQGQKWFSMNSTRHLQKFDLRVGTPSSCNKQTNSTQIVSGTNKATRARYFNFGGWRSSLEKLPFPTEDAPALSVSVDVRFMLPEQVLPMHSTSDARCWFITVCCAKPFGTLITTVGHR